jgi:hypothetical protein
LELQAFSGCVLWSNNSSQNFQVAVRSNGWSSHSLYGMLARGDGIIRIHKSACIKVAHWLARARSRTHKTDQEQLNEEAIIRTVLIAVIEAILQGKGKKENARRIKYIVAHPKHDT